MNQPEVNVVYNHQFEFEGKTLNIVLKSYKEPYENTMDGGVSLYTKVEIFDTKHPNVRWGHIKFINPVFDHEQAFPIFQAIEKTPMKFKDE